MTWIKQRRDELGLSQDDLTARLQTEGIEVTRASISNWETGRHKPPLDDENFRIALSRSLKMSAKDILKKSGYEVVLTHTDEGERAAHIVDQLDGEMREKAVRILEALL